MKKKLILASNNPGKIQELRALLSKLNIEVIPQAELGIAEVAETGLTFIENALLKARHAAHYSELPALADDSGLVVPFLKGAPGIYSSRYAGKQNNDAANREKLLLQLAKVENKNRRAHFHCTLVYLNHSLDPVPLICEGKWQGSILKKPRGENGFGYDALFYDSKLKCSAAELTLAKKNYVSHRGKALTQLIKKLCQHSK